ncbi:exodeoxyribonuclease VII large subunit [Halobacteria archaeon AArc-m2/3/4]|uniref:Exodeoxyribonuclease VII large subunit n=1 Tax=Natronoglomus mannanivorans TaxID=2979990 RepID=A0ABT2QL91_9EURY|nr:exodeoxyribonuclease VII large subunit [Halobacteria archaeon AArc-m2/3/4]
MGVESFPNNDDSEATLETLHDVLDTEDVTFVDALNDEIGTLLENSSALRYDYVVGDVSDYGISGNGHAHFDLVHEGSTLHCVIYSYRLDSLGGGEGEGGELDDGTKAAVKGDLSYYAANGSVSVIVEDVVEIGEGAYQQIYQQNRRILEEDGLLDEETKRPLPAFPRRVGIVTSVDSDARKDAVTSIHGRYPGVDIVVQHTSVQGDDAMLSMMQAISELDDDARVDVIVLTRGGGSEKDLRVFNETPLCRVIHNTETPIVVGVGHENDRTLADEVADRRVMTPTHAGEIVPKKARLEEQLTNASARLETAYGRTAQSRLEAVEGELNGAYEQRVSGELTRLSTDLDRAFEALAAEHLTTLDNRLDHALETLEQRKRHEQEQAVATTEYEQSRRRQRIAIAVLLLLVLGLLGYILL